MMLDAARVMERLDALRHQNSVYTDDRWRVRQIMNGGPDGVMAIMAWDQGKGTSGRINNVGADLPAVNMMASGVERLAQQVGVPPALQMPYGPRDSTPAKEAAEKREHIVEGWDYQSKIHLQYPQVGRWLPGYGYVSWVIRPRRDRVTGQLWPHMELRDPFDSWPGYFGVDQSPTEIAYRRQVPIETLRHLYPDFAWDEITKKRQPAPRRIESVAGGNVINEDSWAGQGGGTQVLEYYNQDGCYVCAPEFGLVLDYYENICDTGPMFIFCKRFSFDRLISAYHHVIGLVGMMAKMNILALIVSEDNAFRETNIIGGDVESGDYERGRGAINYLTNGAVLERPTAENTFGLFQQIDRLERQLRIGAAYDAGADSIAAQGGFITGRGQQELRDPMNANVTEYQTVIAAAMEEADTRRLEWEQRHERNKTKRVFWLDGSKQSSDTYVPAKDIGGNWRSRRIYGMMAGWDDNSKIVAGLQLMQAGVIDKTTMRENLKGLDNIPLIDQRSIRDLAETDLMRMLEAAAAEKDPAAALALVEIAESPDKALRTFKKFFTPAAPQPSPAEAAMMAGGIPGQPPPGAAPADLGPPPSVQTVLSELEASGATGGGVQTVAVQRRE